MITKLKQNKKYIYIIVAVLLVIFVTSYALWQITKEQTSTNKVASGCFNVSIDLDDEPISLTGTMPIKDSEGLTEEPFTFTITWPIHCMFKSTIF